MLGRLLGGFGFLPGASYPFRALAFLLKRSRLWQYLVVPMLLNLVLGGLLYWQAARPALRRIQTLTIDFVQIWDNWTANWPPWLSFLDYGWLFLGSVLQVGLLIGLFFLLGFVLMQFGTLLGAPWYGKLSEQLELERLGQLEIMDVGFWTDIWRAILFEFKKLALIIAAGIPLFLVSWVPGIGSLVAAIAGGILTGLIVCLDFFDAPLERRRYRFRRKIQLVTASFPASGGFGLVCCALISVPLLNLLTIPICVAAGTLFFCDRIWPKHCRSPLSILPPDSSISSVTQLSNSQD